MGVVERLAVSGVRFKQRVKAKGQRRRGLRLRLQVAANTHVQSI